MNAARYVGRVGGLAAALGVGVVIFLASGEASADTADSGVSGSSSSAPAGESASSNTDTGKATGNAGVERGSRAEQDQEGDDAGSVAAGPSTVPARISARLESAADDAPAGRLSSSRVAAEADEAEEAAETDPPTAAEESPTFAAAQAGTTAGPTPYEPVVGLSQGVITGDNVAPSERLNYSVVGDPVAGGKLTLDAATGDFTFLPYFGGLTAAPTDRFEILVAEKSLIDAALESSAIVKLIVTPIIRELHQIPVVSDLLAPVIGRSRVYTVEIPVSAFVTGDPIAFTTTINSFDGTPISTNYFPALGLKTGQVAPTILNGPSLATPGYTDPTALTTVAGAAPGLAVLRAHGYNVITWDPRGEFASGGLLHLDSEDFEARDVSAIIDWMSMLPYTRLGPGPDGVDPLIGMVGGSYGGGIQLTSAGIDQRIDAINPIIAWNSLTSSLYPNDTFKTSWASLLLLALVATGARIDPQIYLGIATGVLFGNLGNAQEQFLADNAPATVVRNITAPTLFIQGTVDDLFTLQQSLDNAMALNPDVPSKMIWYCGGHGVCLDPVNTFEQTNFLVSQQLEWLDTYVKNKGTTTPAFPGPKFTWVDQQGDWYSSNSLPLGAPDRTVEVTGAGGVLPVLPIFGGSGPQSLAAFPVSLGLAARSDQGLSVKVPSQATTTYFVGAPQLTLTYSGLGTGRSVFAQLVDDQTGRVLGNLVSPIPVVLDGREHTVTVPMENIAYTMNPGATLTLQIVGSTTVYENFVSFGALNVSRVGLSLPATDPANLWPRDIVAATTLPTVPGATQFSSPLFGIPR